MSTKPKLTQEEKRVKLAAALGCTPHKTWAVWHDLEKQHGSVCIPSKEEAERYRARMIEQSPDWGGDPSTISEPEPYDDWSHAPDYFNDLNACHEAEKDVIVSDCLIYRKLLEGQVISPMGIAHVEACIRAELLGQVLGLWEVGQ